MSTLYSATQGHARRRQDRSGHTGGGRTAAKNSNDIMVIIKNIKQIQLLLCNTMSALRSMHMSCRIWLGSSMSRSISSGQRQWAASSLMSSPCISWKEKPTALAFSRQSGRGGTVMRRMSSFLKRVAARSTALDVRFGVGRLPRHSLARLLLT